MARAPCSEKTGRRVPLSFRGVPPAHETAASAFCLRPSTGSPRRVFKARACFQAKKFPAEGEEKTPAGSAALNNMIIQIYFEENMKTNLSG